MIRIIAEYAACISEICFYLVTEKGIVSYNIQKDYEQTGTLKWELKRNKTMFLLYLLLAVIQRIVYTRKQLDENEDREV